MTPVRILRVILLAALLAFVLVWIFIHANRASDLTRAHRKASALEASAMKRFAEARGLSPCRYDDRLWTAAAERKLALAGQPRPRALVLVAPTFSDIHVLAFGPAGLDRYTFPRQTAFGPEFTENDQVKPMPVGAVSLPPDSYERVIAAVSRNSEYAVSSSESGHDGVVYYFQNDADQCAFAWSPSKGTIGGHLAGLVDVLAEEHPSAESVEQTLSALENLELAH